MTASAMNLSCADRAPTVGQHLVHRHSQRGHLVVRVRTGPDRPAAWRSGERPGHGSPRPAEGTTNQPPRDTTTSTRMTRQRHHDDGRRRDGLMGGAWANSPDHVVLTAIRTPAQRRARNLVSERHHQYWAPAWIASPAAGCRSTSPQKRKAAEDDLPELSPPGPQEFAEVLSLNAGGPPAARASAATSAAASVEVPVRHQRAVEKVREGEYA